MSVEQVQNAKDLFKEVLGPGKEKTAKLLADNVTQEFKGNTGHHCYALENQVDLYSNTPPNIMNIDRIDAVVSDVLTKLEAIYMELCSKLEKEGYAELENESSDEYLTDLIIANEYEFTEDGKRF